jgi:acetyl esterase/lipase
MKAIPAGIALRAGVGMPTGNSKSKQAMFKTRSAGWFQAFEFRVLDLFWVLGFGFRIWRRPCATGPMSNWRRVAAELLLAAVATLSMQSPAAEPTPAAVPGPEPTYPNVAYGPDPSDVLDFWKASSDKPTPLVVFIHGGGFSAGDKREVFRNGDVITPRLNDGISFAAINYRLVGKAVLPDIMRDCARALQFLRSKDKEWNIDKARVGVYGSSAGAGASLWLAFHKDVADPKSTDPVMRESMRPAVVGALSTQSTYDIRQWESIIGPFPAQFPERLRLGFFHFKSREDEETSEGRRMRADVDIIHLMSKDAAPFFASTPTKVEPAKDMAGYIHHPGHALALEKRAKEVGLECAVFVKDTPVPDGLTANQYMWKFFYDHLGMKPAPASATGQ